MKICTNQASWSQRQARKLLLVMNSAFRISDTDQRKWLMRANITTFLLIATIMQVSAGSFAQSITLKKQHITLDQFFREIRKQTGYSVSYSDKVINDTKSVKVNFKATPIEEALKTVLKDNSLSFDIKNKNITIFKAEKSILENIIARFQEIDVRGRVVDENGEPLVGATVTVKGGKGTKTNANGEFYLTDVKEDATLIISFIGYISKEVFAKANLGDIQLVLGDSKLDEIQIIAYGQVEKKYSTSNIGSIKADAISKQPVSNPLLALQGRVPGLFIQQTSGISAGEVKIIVQGRNSLRQGTSPFYVIDGVPYPENNLQSIFGAAIPGANGSAFNFINPADIESVEILKDADATAIYGSRAANGAILITTKKGKAGATKVDVNMQSGWGRITRKLDLLNTEQYLEMRKEAYFINDGLTTSSPDYQTSYDINGTWDQNRYTDWQDVLVGGTAHFNNLQASVSGGSINTQFLAGMGYIHQTTVYPGDLADGKANVHLNVNHTSTNQRFKFNINGNYLQDNNTLATTDLMGPAVTLAPNAPALYNADGTLNWAQLPNNSTTYSFDNPMAYLLQQYKAKTFNLISNTLLSYEIIKGLELKSSFGYNRLSSDEINITPLTAIKPDFFSRIRRATYSTKSIISWIIEPQLTYNKEYSFGHIDALIGTSFQRTDNNIMALNASGYSNDAQLNNIRAASSVTVNNSLISTYRYNALFGRLNYRLKEKYIINVTARRDGSSRFGSENLFHNFYAVGGAWLFTEEIFIKKNIPFLNSGKFRVSYGTTGSDQIPEYSFLNLYGNTGSTYLTIPTIQANGHANPYLQWEETRKLNFGIDLGFIKDKLTVSGNYYKNRSSNQLVSYNLPIVSGFGFVNLNLPAKLQNTGWEVLVNARPLDIGNFTWTTSINLTIPKNELLEYPGLEKSSNANSFIIGRPVNIIKAYVLNGVSPQTGVYEYRNNKGETVSSPNGSTDQTAIINTNPKYYGGFSNTFRYIGFELDFLFQFVKQTGKNYTLIGSPAGSNGINQPSVVLNRWKKTGDVTSIQKYSSLFDFPYLLYASGSDASYSDASYIRLKNASLSYSLPLQWINKARISHARLYIQGQNLITFTKYMGSDPESQVGSALPPLRMYTLGIQITL